MAAPGIRPKADRTPLPPVYSGDPVPPSTTHKMVGGGAGAVIGGTLVAGIISLIYYLTGIEVGSAQVEYAILGLLSLLGAGGGGAFGAWRPSNYLK
jgi:hypothetical protein